MKSAQIDTRICQALAPIINSFRTGVDGVFVEIEPRAVNYIVTDGHCLIGHRVEVDPDSPANTLLGDFFLPECVFLGDGEDFASFEEHDDKLLFTYGEVAPRSTHP